MKKIITAVAAVAMATSMFAVDFSATAKMAGNLFSLDADKKVSALNLADDAVAGHKPALAFSVADDRAGATVKFVNNFTDDDVDWSTGAPVTVDASKPFMLSEHSIWFKPVDALKITLGNSDDSINQEKIDWCNTDTRVDGFGYKVELSIVDGLTASVLLYPGEAMNDQGNAINGSYWLDDGDIATTAAYVKYAADFGTIGVMADFENNAKKMAFGAGFSGAAGSVAYFVNGMAYLNDGLSSIRGEAYVATNIDSVGINVFLPMTYVMKGANAWETTGKNWHKGGIGYSGVKDGQFILGTTAKVTFPVAGLNGSVYIASNDWLADALAVNVKPGLSGNVGIMSWEASLNMNISKDAFTMNVPFVTTVNF